MSDIVWPPAYKAVEEWTDEYEALLQERISYVETLGFTRNPSTCEELVRSNIVKNTEVPEDWRDSLWFSMLLSSSLMQDICARLIEVEARR